MLLTLQAELTLRWKQHFACKGEAIQLCPHRKCEIHQERKAEGRLHRVSRFSSCARTRRHLLSDAFFASGRSKEERDGSIKKTGVSHDKMILVDHWFSKQYRAIGKRSRAVCHTPETLPGATGRGSLNQRSDSNGELF